MEINLDYLQHDIARWLIDRFHEFHKNDPWCRVDDFTVKALVLRKNIEVGNPFRKQIFQLPGSLYLLLWFDQSSAFWRQQSWRDDPAEIQSTAITTKHWSREELRSSNGFSLEKRIHFTREVLSDSFYQSAAYQSELFARGLLQRLIEQAFSAFGKLIHA